MKSDMHIRKVPLVRADLKCPVCGKPLTRYKLLSVDLYSKDYWKTRVVQRWLLYCDICRLPFASPQMCEKINLENSSFHVEGFPVTQRDGIQSIRSGMQEHAYAWKKIRERERQREQERKKQQELQAQMEAQKEAQLEKECQERMRAIPYAAVMICVQFGSGDARDYIIINKLEEDASPAENILHYRDKDALELLTAAFAWQRIWCGKLHGKSYRVTRTVYASSENRFFVNPSDIGILTLRRQQGRGAQDNALHRIDVLLYSPYNDILVPQDAFIDRHRNVYMDAHQYRLFAHHFGNPDVELDFDEAPSSGFDNLREHSVLYAFGYNVSAKDALPAKMRQELLADLMDLGIVNSKEVIGLLSSFIQSRKDIKFADARWKWQEDLDFTKDYIGKPERFLILGYDKR